jgi:large subunit ribosomal protein L29
MSKETKATKSLSLEELKTKDTDLNAQLFKLRMQKATGQLANTSQIRMVRKELARVKTFLTQKNAGKSAASKAEGK